VHEADQRDRTAEAEGAQVQEISHELRKPEVAVEMGRY
jgi:hypothetical protein